MTVTDQIKILDRKIMQNKAQYDLDRKAAKISALSSSNLDKYEHLTGEDVGLKPTTIEQVKLKYSPLCKIFNKALKVELLKSKEQLKVIKDQLEKQRILSKVKNPNFNNVSFRNLLGDKSMKVF